MKNFKNLLKILPIILVLSLMLALPLSASAASNSATGSASMLTTRIEDAADILYSEEEDYLNDSLETINQKYAYDVLILTLNESITDIAEEYMSSIEGSGIISDKAIILIINTYNYSAEIAISKAAEEDITPKELDNLYQAIYNYDYARYDTYSACYAFTEEVVSAINNDYANISLSSLSPIMIIIIALVILFLLVLFALGLAFLIIATIAAVIIIVVIVLKKKKKAAAVIEKDTVVEDEKNTVPETNEIQE